MLGKVLSGRYEILEEIGKGGMGVVYLAQDNVLHRKVAIKFISPGRISEDHVERFQREARIIAGMDHPSIVGIHDIGHQEGRMYLIMPYVQGTNLRAYISEGSLRIGECLEIGIQVAEALDYSHQMGVVHRDIKPENILFTKNEFGELRARLTDFGLARAATEERLTLTGKLVGTACYLSPEQIYQVEIDGRSDVYSLATVLYECITGEPPFSGDFHEVIYRIVHETPRAPVQKGIQIDKELQNLILEALQKDPNKRPARAKIFAQSLASYKSKLERMGKVETPLLSPPVSQFQAPDRSKFVGREKELVEIQYRLNSAISGECQFVVIGGEQGIGKSRLLDELEMLARARKVQVLHGRFVGEDHGFRYQGFCEAIQEFFRFRAMTSSSSLIDFSDLATDLRAFFPVLGEIGEIRGAVSADFPSPHSSSKDPNVVYDLLARAMIRAGSGKPLLLLFEELHSAGASADALQYIVRRMGPTPTMIVATYRTTEVEKRHPLMRMISSFEGDRRFLSIQLQPFQLSERRVFVENFLGTDQLDDQLLRRINEITEGNPFFIQELLRSLLDTGGIIQEDSGKWIIATEIGGQFLPATVQQTVEKRLRELPAQLHELLAAAAILGKSFSTRDLQFLLPATHNLEELLEQLIHQGFLEEERFSRGDLLAFTSGVLREVLYSGLPRSKRKAHHRKYAEELEKRSPGNLARVYPQLVHHYVQGDVPAKIIHYGLKLAQRSLDAFSVDEAIRAAKTVLDYMEEDSGLNTLFESEAKLILASAYRLKSNFDAALKEAREAIQIAQKAGESQQLTKAFLLAAETAWAARKVEEAQGWVEAGLNHARKSHEMPALARLLSLAATVCNLRGDYEKAQRCLEEMDRIHASNKVEELRYVGGSLVVAIPYSILPIHPVELKLDEEAEILANVFEQLMKMDADGNVIPWLCEKWESSGGKIFTLSVRKNIRFHDGTPLTAQEVSDSLHCAISRAPYNIPAAFAAICGVSEFLSGAATNVSGIHVLSADRVEIQLTEILPIYPALLTELRTAIVREATKEGVFYRLGTGPFQIATYEPQSLTLIKNEHYWKGSFPLLDSLKFCGSLTAARIGEGFRRGEFDLVRDLLPEELEEFLRQRPLRATLAEATKKNVYFILFNIFSAAGSNLNIRRSLTGIIRKQDLVRRTLGRFAQPAEGLFPPGILGHDPEARNYPISPEEATKLLQSSGLFPLKLKAAVHPILQDRYASVTNDLFAAWSEIGVEVSIETPTMESYLGALRNSEGIDLMIGRWIGEYDDPDSFTYTLFHTKAGDRSSFIGSPQLDRWMEEARAESRVGVRERLYRNIESYLLESATFFPLFHEIDFRLANPRIKNLALRSTAPYVNYAEVMMTPTVASPGISTSKSGGSLEIPIAGEVNSLDPSLVSTAVESQVTPAIFETLFRQSEGTIVPWLVDKFQRLDGGSRFWFRLRPDIRFQDGRRLTARDVRYSLERLLLNAESDSRSFFLPMRGASAMISGERGDLEGIRILSATEFTIQLEERISFFPALLAYYSAAIVPEGTEEFRTSWKNGCVGTGPYRVVRFQPSSKLELEANPYYWRTGFPRNDKLVFTFGLTPGEIFKQFVNGKFSVAWDLVPADVERLLADRQYASCCREIPRLCTYFAAFNTNRGLLANEEIRKKIVNSVDVEKLIQKNLGRLAIPAYGIIPPGLIGYQAKKLNRHASAFKPDREEEITCVLNPAFSGPYSSVAKDLFLMLRHIGFSVRVINQRRHDYREFHEHLDAADADFALARWVGDYPDTDTFAGILNTKQKIAGKFCGSPEVDRLIAAGRIEPDPAIRSKIYSDMEQILEQQGRLLPLFHEQVFCFASGNVEGFELNFFSPIVAYEKIALRG